MKNKKYHLLPEPKQVEIRNEISISPADLVIVVPSQKKRSSLIDSGCQEIVNFIHSHTGISPDIAVDNQYKKRHRCKIILGNKKENILTKKAVEKKLLKISLPQKGYHPYQISTVNQNLFIFGKIPLGTYYGLKTLKQMISFKKNNVILPLADISDSSDLAERGFWDYFYPAPLRKTSELYTFKNEKDWYLLIDDLSDYKINLMELLLTGEHGWGKEGLIYHSRRFPKLVEPGIPKNKNRLVKNVIDYANNKGIRIIPGLVHPEQIVSILNTYPETKAIKPKGCQPYLLKKLLCFSHPQTKKVIGGIIEEISALFSQDSVCIWMPENLGYCTCKSCGSRSKTIKAFLNICNQTVKKICRKHSGFRLRVLVSFLRYSDEILSYISKDIDLVYYECDRHGLYGFDEDKKIPEHLADYAQNGHNVLGCLSYRGSGLKFVPRPYFNNIRDWLKLLYQKGFCGVNGSIYSNPGVNRLNLLCMADFGWNVKGHTIDKFIAATLHLDKKDNVKKRSRILKILSQCWQLFHMLHPGIMDIHALKRMINCRPLDYLDAVYTVDSFEYKELPRLKTAVKDILIACKTTDSIHDKNLQLQVYVCHCYISYLYHVFSAYHVYGRQLWPDPEKGPWENWIDEITTHLTSARKAISRVPELTSKIVSVYPDVKSDPTIDTGSVVALLDEMLTPQFRKKLKKVEWPDINSFA